LVLLLVLLFRRAGAFVVIVVVRSLHKSIEIIVKSSENASTGMENERRATGAMAIIPPNPLCKLIVVRTMLVQIAMLVLCYSEIKEWSKDVTQVQWSMC
jgi:hypothetical protein